MKRILAMLLAMMMLFALAACGGSAPAAETAEEAAPAVEEASAPEAPAEEPAPAAEEDYEPYDVRSMADKWVYHEVTNVTGESKYVEIPYYSLENVVYVTNPVDTDYQYFNIYVPACYMTEDENGRVVPNDKGLFGVMGEDGSTIMYMTEEAPVIYINTINGYAASTAPVVTGSRQGQNAGYYYQFLEQGFVLVCVGARGRTSSDEMGVMDGGVPNGLVDLKSGVRWLKYNDDYLPGDSDKIVTIGVSAGGGMSSMLGATGNAPEFEPYLEEAGAAPATDNVWASVAYCPITNLEFADGAAEWQNGVKTDGEASGEMTVALSQSLLDEFIAYMQESGFDLGDDGYSGDFYEGYKAEFENSFNSYIAMKGMDEEDSAGFIASIDPDGAWLTWDGSSAHITSVKDYVDNMWNGMLMSGQTPAFDVFDSTSMEGQVFAGHFSWLVTKALEDIAEDYPEAAELAAEYQEALDNGQAELGKMYDPFAYVVEGTSDVAEHWRFRIGGADSNVTHALAWILMNALNDYRDVDTDYGILYGIGHQTVEYDPYDLIDWIYESDLGVKPAYDNIKSIQTVDDGSGAGEVGDPADVAGTYTLSETNAMGMHIDWTLELHEDGTYALSEVGVVEMTYTGNFCVVGDLISCGPINEAQGPRGDAFGEGYISVWKLNGDKCEHADVTKYTDPATAGSGGEAVDVSGTYTLSETNAMGMDIDWTLELSEDGTYALSETGVVDMTYTGEYTNSGTTVSCGPINEAMGPRGDAFGSGSISVWTVDPSTGKCEHADLGKYKGPEPPEGGASSEEPAEDVVGIYTLSETNAMGMDIDWTLELRADNTYVLSEVGVVEMSYTGTYGYADGYVSCGPINEEQGPRGDAFGDGYISVWTLSGDKCEHADLGHYTAP